MRKRPVIGLIALALVDMSPRRGLALSRGIEGHRRHSFGRLLA